MNTYMCEVGSQSAVACCCGVKNFSFISFSLIHSLTSSAGSRSHSLSQPLSLSSSMLSLSHSLTQLLKDIAVKVKSDFYRYFLSLLSRTL